MELTAFYQVFVLALATTAISLTITRAKVFASFREWVADRNQWLGDLFSCSYCTSHWVAAVFVLCYQPVLIPLWIVLDLIVSLFATVAIAAFLSGVIAHFTFNNPQPVRRLVVPTKESLDGTEDQDEGTGNTKRRNGLRNGGVRNAN